MMDWKRIAKFHIVSKEEFIKAYNQEDAVEIYNEIKLPQRATRGSAGYDFYAPFSLN